MVTSGCQWLPVVHSGYPVVLNGSHSVVWSGSQLLPVVLNACQWLLVVFDGCQGLSGVLNCSQRLSMVTSNSQ